MGTFIRLSIHSKFPRLWSPVGLGCLLGAGIGLTLGRRFVPVCPTGLRTAHVSPSGKSHLYAEVFAVCKGGGCRGPLAAPPVAVVFNVKSSGWGKPAGQQVRRRTSVQAASQATKQANKLKSAAKQLSGCCPIPRPTGSRGPIPPAPSPLSIKTNPKPPEKQAHPCLTLLTLSQP